MGGYLDEMPQGIANCLHRLIMKEAIQGPILRSAYDSGLAAVDIAWGPVTSLDCNFYRKPWYQISEPVYLWSNSASMDSRQPSCHQQGLGERRLGLSCLCSSIRRIFEAGRSICLLRPWQLSNLPLPLRWHPIHSTADPHSRRPGSSFVYKHVSTDGKQEDSWSPSVWKTCIWAAMDHHPLVGQSEQFLDDPGPGPLLTLADFHESFPLLHSILSRFPAFAFLVCKIHH